MSGTRALVTGAASGIGKAVSAKLYEEGAEVFAADIAFPESTPVSGGGLTHVHLDVTDSDDWMRGSSEPEPSMPWWRAQACRIPVRSRRRIWTIGAG
jgi:NAD(P)-dependent dehydrogenase (short-subunit alcohol dehydrogenase family)